jgi:deazaflavin-dependent oxidoreductase (nitroreductase family)
MTDADVPEHLPDWIRDHALRYLETDGAEGHLWDSSGVGGPGPVPTLLLRTVGRRSGRPLLLPLIYGRSGDGYVVVASRGGDTRHPAWFLNLQAQPEVEIQVEDQRMAARARVAEGAEREALWRQMAEIFPPYDDYRARTERRIPVVVLEPQEG